MSEYPPGTPGGSVPLPGAQPDRRGARSRLVVVEGVAKSGSRISVDHALDLGREVYAVPGPVTSPLAETPLEMIREGAT